MKQQQVTQPSTDQQARAYVICSSPRTGSYLLCEGLEGTGVLGVPREYFDEHKGKAKWWIDRLGIKGDEDYVEKVIAHGTTPNGVFGLKLHSYQVPDLINRFAKAAPPGIAAGTDLHVCLRRRFSSVQYMWLRRKNKVAQGISYYRAFQSGVWHQRGHAAEGSNGANGEGRELAFNFEEIDRHVRMVEDYDRQWQEYFARRKFRVLVLIYEDFVSGRESYERTVRETCKYLGFPPETLPIRTPTFSRQADQLSLEWEREYRRLRIVVDNVNAGPRASVTLLCERPHPTPVAGPVITTPAVPMPKPAPAALAAPAVPIPIPPEPAPQTLEDPFLIAYDINPGLGIRIATPSARRDWMDRTPSRFAYRCLPLVIANQNGWLLLCPSKIRVGWIGGAHVDTLKIEYQPGERRRFALSHFGCGILTFSMNFVFRTPPGYNLHVRGPANMPKDGIYPLEGIVETDWSEATFTMNWQLTRTRHVVTFEKDEPFAMLTPVARGEIERFQPEIRLASDDPEIESGYREWAKSRSAFNSDLKVQGSDAQKKKWQRHYVHGKTVSERQAREHQTGLSLREFLDKRK